MPTPADDVADDPATGCLLGCAVGDALLLPYEGMRPRRVARLLGEGPLRHRLLVGRGMVSDDTDHTIFVAQALARHPEDAEAFARCLAGKLRLWLLCLPAGIGLATLRSILKLWAGVPICRSGVWSAGNGPAMRSAIIGVRFAADPARRRAFVAAATYLTHRDPKATYGAQAIADLAALSTLHPAGSRPSLAAVRESLEAVSDDAEWRQVVATTLAACEAPELAAALGTSLGERARQRGVSGYVYHTVPAAVAAWWRHYGDFAATLDAVARLGGDTDTVGAIAGALAGAAVRQSGIPAAWISGIVDRPHSVALLRGLGARLDADAQRDAGDGDGVGGVRAPAPTTAASLRMSPWLLPRGVAFAVVVLAHGFRRLLPPYG